MLSIIINTNNRVKELDICLDFISKQTFFDYEIIIIDQNENLPGIEDIIKKYSKIIYKRFNKNLGPAVGRNFGSKLAKHALLLFLDDDAYLKDKFTIEKTIKFFLKNNYGQLGLQSYSNLENNNLHTSQCIIGDDGFLDIKKSKDPNLNLANERFIIETSF
jgi:GT2 family glycosyltransferase